MNEFDIIKIFFAKQNLERRDVILGIGDDAAITEIPEHHQLVITTDTLISGVHFPVPTAAFDIGFKSLAVNLSDLAAMGATPAWFTLAISLPESNEKWLQEFCNGLFSLANRYKTELIGGDLTRGPLSITIAAYGFVPKGLALKRSTAKPNDLIYVTNSLGDAAFGLQSKDPYFLNRLNRPEPRIEIGEKLRSIATSAIDISDGLAADLGHILEASDVGATVFVDDLPLSSELTSALPKEKAIELALTGGDDYELCFTVPEQHTKKLNGPYTCIGNISEKKGLDLRYKNGKKYEGTIGGYNHFAK